MRITKTRRQRLFKFKRICVFADINEASQKLYNSLANQIDTPMIFCHFSHSFEINDNDLILLKYDYQNKADLLQIINEIQAKNPDVTIALFNVNPDDDVRPFLSRHVVKGSFKSQCTPELLAKGIKKIDDDGFWFSRNDFEAIASMRRGSNVNQLSDQYSLSRREQQILSLIADGQTAPQIADSLSLSANTVKSHKNKLYKKLGVNSREEAVTLMNVINTFGKNTNT